MSETKIDPLGEYRRRLEARRVAARLLDERHISLGNARLAIAAAGALGLWLAFARHLFSGWWLLLLAAAFLILAVIHARVLRARRSAQRAAAFYERGLARLEDRWQGMGAEGERFGDPAHPYAEDLDIFGRGSLFQLLSTARLRTGEETLAGWLLNPADPDEILSRHGAVEELRGRVGLREELALLGDDVPSGINPRALAKWAEQPLVFDSNILRAGAAALSVLAVASLVVWAVFGSAEFFLLVAATELILMFRLRSRIAAVREVVGEPAYGLALLAEVLARLERESFTSPYLLALRKKLDVEAVPASRRIARLNRLMELLDSADHVLLRAIGPVLLYVPQIVFAIEAWRKKSGPYVRRWLAAVGEIEAICSLASYAYEHPQDPFPEIVQDGAACYEGEALAHPLLAESRAVRNDIQLGGELRMLVVSGSNMSGKSTLLRTVGINAVLAFAGAPVRARRLRLSPLAVGASLRTLDSLQSGTSRFYAEIKRLRQLVELTDGPLPLLFLLDELLQGTNSHDRRIGAEAVLRGMVDRGAIGFTTTHDLALAAIADDLAPRARNVHFEDYLKDGKMSFDYQLRPGIVRKSNALELMRSIGLDV